MEAVMAKYTKDTKLKVILDDPEACAILQKYYPVDLGNPMMMAHGMTLEKCFSFPQVELSDDEIQQIYQELEALS